MHGLLAQAPEVTSFGISGRAHVVVIVVVVLGAWWLLRLLRQRQMRGKYTLLWMTVFAGVMALAAWPELLDRTSKWLRVYDAPNLLFLLALAFLLSVCVYFSWELSRLEERTRILAEELAILRGERGGTTTTTTTNELA